MADTAIKLLLVDDHRVVRLGLRTLFETAPQFNVVAEAGTVAEAVLAARRSQPDVVVMDIRLPDGSGVEACREIRSARPRTRVLMLTSYADEDAVVASIMAGAAGYLLKQTDPERLVEATELVAGGGSLLDPAVTQTVLQWMRRLGTQAPSDPLISLSDQERKILPLLAEGKTNREIAAQLYLSEHTVKTYVSNILQKLHLSRRAEAAAYIARRYSSSDS
ncbi:MAG TPA: response regulator transcription factor [Chloroflexota bacterium]|nr:response regulator transcription factor [Chloroflexota bacterium]